MYIYGLKECLDIFSFSLVIFFSLWSYGSLNLKVFFNENVSMKYVIYNRITWFIFNLTAITAIMCVQEIETKSLQCWVWCCFVVVFPLFRTFSRFFNVMVATLVLLISAGINFCVFRGFCPKSRKFVPVKYSVLLKPRKLIPAKKLKKTPEFLGIFHPCDK